MEPETGDFSSGATWGTMGFDGLHCSLGRVGVEAFGIWGFSQHWDTLLGVPNIRITVVILGSVLGPPYSGRLQYIPM